MTRQRELQRQWSGVGGVKAFERLGGAGETGD